MAAVVWLLNSYHSISNVGYNYIMIFVEIAHNIQSIFLYGCDVICQHQKAKILGSTIIARFWPCFL